MITLPRGLARHLARHPQDVWAVVSSGWALRRRGWWRQRPFLPVPDEAYWKFRMVTAYGAPDATPSVEDLIAAARWSRTQRRNR
jgi:hypothetical protein